MIEYIRSLIMGLIAGITAPLPVPSAGHFSIGNKLLGLTDDVDVSALYYSAFMVVFSIVIMINIRELYAKLPEGFSKKRKNYMLRISNLALSVALGVLTFIPIPWLGKSFADYFVLFFDSENILNSILIGVSAVFTGFILVASVWYIKSGRKGKKKTVPARSAIRMCMYSLPAHIIPGTSKVALSSANLALCDVNCDVIFREVYFYLAPQIFVVNLIRTVLLLLDGVRPDVITLIIGAVAVFIASLLVVAIIRKSDSGKLLLLLSVYTIIFGIGVIAYTIVPIFYSV